MSLFRFQIITESCERSLNLPIKTDSIVTCILCMLEHVCYEPFSLKNCRFGRYFMLIV